MNIKKVLDQSITRALQLAGASDSSAVIKQSQKAEFGQYQANGVMGAAKKLKMNPRELAAQVIEALDLPIAEKVEIAGPGFINIHLDAQAVAAALSKLHTDSMLGIEAPPRQSYVIDYSAPNLAKEMHIGHLRSTTMGDAAARILDFLGHDVTRANHVGDWGAQFGSLLAYMDQLEQSGEILSTELKDLEVFYKKASALFKSDEEFAIRARAYVVRLQSGDDRCLELWQQFISESINHCQGVYDKLNITLTRQDIKAESSYNDDLAVVVSELKDKGLLEISDGAKCVFLEEFKGKDDKPLPAIVQKSDGGYPYLASDIAALRYRSQTLNSDNALYFIDARQRLHMRQLFAVSKAAGYLTQSKVFKHLPFGVILKDDGTPFKTRDGADVKLIDVIDEAIERAFRLVTSKNPDLDETIRRNISEVVGVGAIKYAELSKNRTTDYIFDWDTMLSFEGNTAPYLQYAYTRIRSIFRRAEIDSTSLDSKIVLQHPVEFALAVKLLQFPEAIDSVTDDFQANVLCNYLFEVSGQFMSFYEACPILNQDDEIKNSRLMIADITSKILKQGLELLGIQTVEKM
ncbi:MAG: arginine--tRNA ligase [Pseudomonadales bacterium]|jgi:arginyl-tRNA synthetase|tara:strand:+ start:6131 stop:7855 length:1725 start_codon:yes stop_codon:yes gene_type:complete